MVEWGSQVANQYESPSFHLHQIFLCQQGFALAWKADEPGYVDLRRQCFQLAIEQ